MLYEQWASKMQEAGVDGDGGAGAGGVTNLLADGGAGAGGVTNLLADGGGKEAVVTPADARTYLADYMSDPEVMKGWTDERVLKLHTNFRTKIGAAVDAAVTAAKAPPEIPVADARKYLAEKAGIKAEDVAKLDDKAAQAKAKEHQAAEVAKPVEYKDFKLPEGVKLDDKMMTDFKAILAPAKVPQEIAQKLVDLYAGQIAGIAQAPYKLWENTQLEWQAKLKADPGIGGEKLAPAVARIGEMIDKFGGPEVRMAFRTTGAGNNPDIVKFMAKLSLAFTEGGSVNGNPGGAGAGANGSRSAADVLYPPAQTNQ